MSDTGGFTGFLMVLFLTHAFPVIAVQYFQMKDIRLSFDTSRTENPMSHQVDCFLVHSVGKLGVFLAFQLGFSDFCKVETKTLWLEVVFLHAWTL